MGGGSQPSMDTLNFYKELAEVPSYSSASFLGPNALNLHLTIRSHLLKTRLKSSKTIVLSSPDVLLPFTELPSKSSEFFSQDGKLKGVLKTIGDKRYIEVWDWAAGSRVGEKEVTEDVGDFLDDETWGTPTFSPFSKQLVFSANRLPPKPPSTDLLAKHRFTPTWGEIYRTLIFPSVFIFDFATSKPFVNPVISRELDPKVSFAQAQFAFVGGKDKLVLTGFDTLEDGRRYGIVYCTNRRSGIWLVDVPEKESEGAKLEDLARLSHTERSARSPRVFTRQAQDSILVYLSNPLGGAHNSCTTLHARELTGSDDAWSSSTSDVLVEPVWSPSSTSFPGLYLNSLPPQPFLDLPHHGAQVVLASIFHSRSTIYSISLSKGIVLPVELTPEREEGSQPSWSVLATDGMRRIVGVREGLISLKKVYVGEVAVEGAQLQPSVRWGKVVETGRISEEAASTLASLKPSIFETPNLPFPVQTLLLSPSPSSSPPPLILIPHGGPHGTTITTFTPSMAALVQAGFAIASVNYSGSLGFGQKAVQSLVGECGVLDVSDCFGVVEEWKRLWRGKGEGEGKLFISGGSHGGFLTAHLTSLYPDLFTAAVLRNPVTSFGENCTITDIPDWNFGEMGLPFSFSSSDARPSLTPTVEQYALFQSRSPISKVNNVQAATLILMGEEDRRVPPTQTKAWYHSLKGKSDWIQKQNALLPEGAKKENELHVECLVFPGEGHALDGVEAEIVGFEVGLDWFRKLAKF